MPIQVITRGIPPEEFKYRVGCHTCHSQLEYLKGDCRYVDDQREGGHFLTCPVCRATIRHSDSNRISGDYER